MADYINLTNESFAASLANVSTALTEISSSLTAISTGVEESSRASAAAGILQEKENHRTQELIRQLQKQAEQNIVELSDLKKTELEGKGEARRLIEKLFELSRELSARLNQIESSAQTETENLSRRLQQVRTDLAGQATQTKQLLAEARSQAPATL